MDRSGLTSDDGNDVSLRTKRDNLWDWSHCACHCLDIAMQAALQNTVIQKSVEPWVDLTWKFSKSKSLWWELKKIQLEVLFQDRESSDDEGDPNFDGDERLYVGRDNKPQVTKILRVFTPVATRWNSMNYLIRRALALKDPLIAFIISM